MNEACEKMLNALEASIPYKAELTIEETSLPGGFIVCGFDYITSDTLAVMDQNHKKYKICTVRNRDETSLSLECIDESSKLVPWDEDKCTLFANPPVIEDREIIEYEIRKYDTYLTSKQINNAVRRSVGVNYFIIEDDKLKLQKPLDTATKTCYKYNGSRNNTAPLKSYRAEVVKFHLKTLRQRISGKKQRKRTNTQK